MVAQLEQRQHYSPAQYLEQEVKSEIRHEYLDGEIIPMTGGTPNHNQILLNIAGALNFLLRQQPYRVFAADQRVWLPERRIYTYPDIFIVREPIQLQEGRKDTVVNPVVILEVLSASTRTYDKDAKFAAYRSIASFQEYILVDQYQPQVDHYYKLDDKKWAFVDYNAPDAKLQLETVAVELSFADIYNKVDFSAEEMAETPDTAT